jgi:hypothetical protein
MLSIPPKNFISSSYFIECAVYKASSTFVLGTQVPATRAPDKTEEMTRSKYHTKKTKQKLHLPIVDFLLVLLDDR